MKFLDRLFGTAIDGVGARRLVSEGALLLDVRTPEEFTEGHLPGAVNIPVHDLSGRLGELSDRERAIVVYCRSGMRSGRAAGVLRRAGYRTVHNLGGLSNW